MLVFEEEWEVFGYKVQSPLRGYLGEGVREFLDLSLQDIQNLVKESPEGGVVFSLVVHLLNLFLGLSQRYGFPGVLPNITNLERPPSGTLSKSFSDFSFLWRLSGCVVSPELRLEIRRGIP